jgi:pyridoxal phosphate enzyme (YggS family)
MALEKTITSRLQSISERIRSAAARVSRNPDEIRLIAVTKTFDRTYVDAAIAAGLVDLGENKVQEAIQKQAKSQDTNIHWHLIGHLQSNKARKAVSAFDWIHTVDSLNLLQRLDQAADQAGCSPNVLLQVDLAGEPSKHGATETEVRQIVDAAGACTAVRIRGLMVLPPWSEDPERTRHYFRRLRLFRDELRPLAPSPIQLDHLSMGMSHDFEVAIEEGATLVRVGTALFGPRPTPQISHDNR